ncbi:MAG: hypothetical protein O7198_00375, partial [Wolbachia endosymbiont of Nomada marshamella]|nr:hypothetical protein [Wolbachia endosymbiont of Nomada marshamella]
MSNLFNKANTFYFVASSLATLTLLTSLALTVTSNVPLPLILALATLSVLVLALSYKIISNNKKLEVERNKFAQKEQELENKITLGSVDKILEKPYKSSNKIEKTHKNLSSFIKSGKNAPK